MTILLHKPYIVKMFTKGEEERKAKIPKNLSLVLVIKVLQGSEQLLTGQFKVVRKL